MPWPTTWPDGSATSTCQPSSAAAAANDSDWRVARGAAHAVGFIIALRAITYLHVVLGEMIPKALALQSPEQVSLRVNPVMRLFGVLFRPMVHVLNAIALGLLRLLRIPEPDQRMALHTSAELEIVTDEAADTGQLGAMQ